MIPRLIHPIPITVEQIDTTVTTYNAAFRESNAPTGATFKPPFVLQGQIVWGTADEFRMTIGGSSPTSDGHLTFSIPALQTLGVTLHVGDRVSWVAEHTLRYRITYVKYSGHYAGRAWLLMCGFKYLEASA